MLKKVYDLKVIGSGLAILYAVSLILFMRFVGVSDLPFKMYIYVFLFVTLFIAALAVISLKE